MALRVPDAIILHLFPLFITLYMSQEMVSKWIQAIELIIVEGIIIHLTLCHVATSVYRKV